MATADRGERILSLYLTLSHGEAVNKAWAAGEAGISLRTFERDVEALRACLSDHHTNEDLVFDKSQNCYRLERQFAVRERRDFLPSEALVLLSVLFESGTLRPDELAGLTDAVIEQLPVDQQTGFRRRFGRKMVDQPLTDQGQPLLKLIDDLLYVLNHGRYIRAQYRISEAPQELLLKPVELDYTPPNFLLLAFVWLNGAWKPTSLEVQRIGAFALVRGEPENAGPALACDTIGKDDYIDLKEWIELCRDQENFL